MEQKILIVDDSKSLRLSMKFMLEEAGYSVTEAEDGQEGLSKSSCDLYKLIISDVNMPNMDGLSMISQIRSGSVNRFVPILVVTTEGQAGKIEQGKQVGASGWIVKPFNAEQLIATVKKLIS